MIPDLYHANTQMWITFPWCTLYKDADIITHVCPKYFMKHMHVTSI